MKLFLLFFLTLLAVNWVYCGDPGAGSIWPQPKQMTSTGQTYTFTVDTTFTSDAFTCFILQDALLRTKQLIMSSSLLQPQSNNKMKKRNFFDIEDSLDLEFKEIFKAQEELESVNVVINSPCNETKEKQYPNQSMNESYSIQFVANTAILKAQEVWGALYALETFSQLIYRSNDGSWKLNGTTIYDEPAFAYRSILLDTARHFLPKKNIYQHLEAMSYNKMNVFHWHIVDDESFPYQSFIYPSLSQKGAFKVDSLHIYSQQDIQDVIEFARRRGIRVVPEFDTPGHTQSWGKGQPDLLTECYSQSKPSGYYGPIDPSKESSYTFLSNLFAEITRVFPDSYVHLGGDEVPFGCWESNPNITTFMKKQGFGTNYSKLEEYYEQSLINLVSAASPSGKKTSFVVWQEIVDNQVSVPKSTIVQVWKNGWYPELEAVTKKGFPAILSSCWYLDLLSLGDWISFYACDPLAFNGTTAQKKLVIGGEACLWGEAVDSTNSISQFWPRASAVAERLWSQKQDWQPNMSVFTRIDAQRCRMLYRGLNVQPPQFNQHNYGYCSFGQY